MFSKFRSLIFKINPETAHNLAIKSLKFNLVKNIFDSNKDTTMFHTTLFGKKIKNPIGIAAGFDKNAEVYNPLFKFFSNNFVKNNGLFLSSSEIFGTKLNFKDLIAKL